MTEIKSRHYKKLRRKNLLRAWIKKIARMSSLIIVGEYILLNALNMSLSQQNLIMNYRTMPGQIINLAVSERPILRVAQAYTSIKKNIDFDKIILRHHPVQVKGTRLDFRTSSLQDEEGAKLGYVFEF